MNRQESMIEQAWQHYENRFQNVVWLDNLDERDAHDLDPRLGFVQMETAEGGMRQMMYRPLFGGGFQYRIRTLDQQGDVASLEFANCQPSDLHCEAASIYCGSLDRRADGEFEGTVFRTSDDCLVESMNLTVCGERASTTALTLNARFEQDWSA